MVRGLRVVFSPSADSHAASSPPVPQAGTHGTITAARTPDGLRTYLEGPRGGLVYVEWDADALVCAVSMRDLTLEPAAEERHP